MVEWLVRRDSDRQSLGSKPTRVILWCPWKQHLAALSLLDSLGNSSKFEL